MNPKQIIESAAHAYATAIATNIELIENFYRGIENSHDADSETEAEPQTIEVPCVILDGSGDFVEVIPQSRTYRGTLVVSVLASATKQTNAEFDLMCQEVFSKFAVQDLAAQLTASAVDFHCYEAHPGSISGAYKTSSGLWENSLNVECVIACADLV